MTAKTGGMGTAWVTLPPKPARVSDHYSFWAEPPPELSERCTYWVEQLERGWVPNRHVRIEGYDAASQWFGVYIWEYLNIISPMISRRCSELRGTATR